MKDSVIVVRANSLVSRAVMLASVMTPGLPTLNKAPFPSLV